MATRFCPRCGSPWANAPACGGCGYSFDPPVPQPIGHPPAPRAEAPHGYPPPPPHGYPPPPPPPHGYPPPPPQPPHGYPPPPPPPHGYPPPPPPHGYPPPPPHGYPPPPPPGYLPPSIDEAPDIWARRGSIGTFIIALLLGGVVPLGFAFFHPGALLSIILGLTGVATVVALIEGIRGYRGNPGAQLRAGAAASYYAVLLFWLGNVQTIGGERLWAHDRMASKMQSMLLLLALTCAIAAAECFIGHHLARTKR